MDNFFELKPKKPKIWTDIERQQFAISISTVPLRVHAPNGGYLFSVKIDDNGARIIFQDETFTDHPQRGSYRMLSWENPLGADVQRNGGNDGV